MYRLLTNAEISQLESQHCSAEDWSTISIHSELNLKYVHGVRFSGTCRLGKFEKSFLMPGGMRKHSGIFHATLHNVSVGNDCCIENIKNYIANYDIEEDCFIENCDIILVDGKTSFGCGVEVSVLCETGGREVAIHDGLTAHEAYITAMYRHRPMLIQRIKDLVAAHTAKRTSNRGTIAAHSTVVDTGYIKNVYIGPGAKIEGAGRLKNGSLMSRTDSPIHIGYGVIADDFIVQDGSSIEDGTSLTRCFVGQACTFKHGYSASDSLFFCNCHEENGEACSIFAGPFTVTHHKSTLLIAGMFSFMNAGSGSNQSNHMYKLGPIHQGAMERGAKTASDSYILWPARIGAFSLVMGRHTTNPDTSDMPFSYLIEKDGVTYLAPAVALRSVGTIRDAQKWPKRDKRHREGRLDNVNFNLLSPYTIQKMLRGLKTLKQLKEISGATSDTYAYQSARITGSAMNKGINLYTMAINKFLGNSVISRLEKVEGKLEHFRPTSEDGTGDWVDLCGLIAPKKMLIPILDRIQNGEIGSLEEVNAELSALHQNYYDLEWQWAYRIMLDFYGIDENSEITPTTLADIIRKWKDSVVSLDQMLWKDARKEFSLSARTGFGFDGQDSTVQTLDFSEVRGQFESNPFVMVVEEHIRTKSALADKWIDLLG
ncbi:MAG: DUF4954 family protein [Bacteroidaceae bacterium]|nr:DUF4954 family protein [Bacteroidaceae bacterium]